MVFRSLCISVNKFHFYSCNFMINFESLFGCETGKQVVWFEVFAAEVVLDIAWLAKFYGFYGGFPMDLLYCWVCCCYKLFLLGYLVNDRLVRQVLEKYLPSWVLINPCWFEGQLLENNTGTRQTSWSTCGKNRCSQKFVLFFMAYQPS